MDLRIIIVTYNNRSTIERLLSSLPAACLGLSWEVTVVDNASSDGTVSGVEQRVWGMSGLRLIQNTENRGFAAACNQGLAGSEARYDLLLNPDTVCPSQSLTSLVHAADAHPRAGIIGPKLLNEDGSVQTSIRRFPQFWDQVGILLKLHNFFPGLPGFKRYFASDLSLDQEAVVDQVMGACFLIRRELIAQIGGLDERYFAWYEEVDYCVTAKRAGWDVVYIPSVSVIHGGGHSFAQVFAVKKQKILNASLSAYAKKWWGTAPWIVMRCLSPISLALAWLAERLGFAGAGSRRVLHRETSPGATDVEDQKRRTTDDGRRTILLWLLAILAMEAISAATIFHNSANSIAAILLTGVVALISFKRPTMVLAMLALELVIGSMGSLLQVGGWPGLSIRICLFAAFFIGWGGNLLATKRLTALTRLIRPRSEWMFVAIMVAYGCIRGFLLKNVFLIADVNAWVFLALLLPVLDLAERDGLRLRSDVLPAIIAGICWLGIETLGLEYLFSHGFAGIASNAYLWVRRTGVGEVTLVTVNAFRIFLQSHIYAMVGLLGMAGWLLASKSSRRLNDFFLILCLTSLGISLSRSIWIGTFVGMVALCVMLRKSFSVAFAARFIADGIVALALIFVVIAFPIPHVDYASLKDLFGSRVSTSDAAAQSRWSLFPVVAAKIRQAPLLGHGFGATITYASKDPRIVAQGKGGMITEYAFEWGWLEHWVKMGVFGVLAMGYLLWRLIRRLLASSEPDWIRFAGVSIVLGLAVTHFLTPYLNHPLGFGILLIIEGVISTSSRRDTTVRLQA